MSEHHGKHIAPSVDEIQRLAREGAIEFTVHAALRLRERGILAVHLLDGLRYAVAIVRDYPTDPRGHSCVVRCMTPSGALVDAACAVVERSGGHAVVIISVWPMKEETP